MKGSAIFRACVDTGATSCALSDVDCANLGLVRKGKERVRLMTVNGETLAPLCVATLMKIESTKSAIENVEVVGNPCLGFRVFWV